MTLSLFADTRTFTGLLWEGWDGFVHEQMCAASSTWFMYLLASFVAHILPWTYHCSYM